LWLDLSPTSGVGGFSGSQFTPNSTREFLTRVTTLAHPWGYQPDDKTSRISASDAQEAIAWEFEGKNPPLARPASQELCPWRSNAPVPLSWLMSAIGESDDLNDKSAFWQKVQNRLTGLNATHRWPVLALEVLSKGAGVAELSAIYDGICRAAKTSVVLLVAPPDILKQSRRENVDKSASDGDVASIEHLFNRLNGLGTPLTGEELAYSMIKAYWPDIAEVIDEVVEKKCCRFPASLLAVLSVRAALTPTDKGKIARGLSISQLRAIASAKEPAKGEKNSIRYEHREKIAQFLKAKSGVDGTEISRLANACEQVDKWLVYDPDEAVTNDPLRGNGLPPVLVSSFARSNPDTYLFILHLADLFRSNAAVAQDRRWRDLFRGLAMLVHWFGQTGRGLDIADMLMDSITGGEISPERIGSGLADAIRKKLIHTPRRPDELAGFIRLGDDQQLLSWTWWKSLIEAGPENEPGDRQEDWWPFLQRVVWQRELLLYGQRHFLHQRFQDYDPSRRDLWESHNRPWDFDHIHPSAYFYNAKKGDYAELCRQWGNCIGNLRAWPFQKNRADQKKEANKKLGNQPDELAASLIESEVELDAFSHGDASRFYPEPARALCEAIKFRFIRIYRHWYDSAGICTLLPSQSAESGSQKGTGS
jgi:hypothetical protein